MSDSCPDGTMWNRVVVHCVSCHVTCREPPPHLKCAEHCASLRCLAQSGHHYDRRLQRCVRCASVCGRHPPECTPHCPAPLLPALCRTPGTPALGAGPSQSHPAVLLPASIPLLYSLLGLCVLMLGSALGLSLLVFQRRAKRRPTRAAVKPGPTVKPGLMVTTQEEGSIQKQYRGDGDDDGEGAGRGKYSKHALSACRSNPTESCECTHCFPELTVPGPGGDRLHHSYSSTPHSATHWGQEEQGVGPWGVLRL